MPRKAYLQYVIIYSIQNRKQKMLGYSRSTQLKNSQKFPDDSLQATKCETHYANDTNTQRSNFFGQNPISETNKIKIRASAAFQKARNMVQQAIQESDSKSRMNMSALQEVYYCNSQAMEDVPSWQQQCQSILIKKNRGKNKSSLMKSKFEKSQQRPQSVKWQPNTHKAQVEQLYQKLGKQQQKSQFLQSKCEYLQQQNKELRSQSCSLAYQTLWNQLQVLKRENSELRGATVQLLKKIR